MGPEPRFDSLANGVEARDLDIEFGAIPVHSMRPGCVSAIRPLHKFEAAERRSESTALFNGFVPAVARFQSERPKEAGKPFELRFVGKVPS